MALILEIKGNNSLLLGDRSRVIVPDNGLTIGRKSDRDWILNNPEISGEHAIITFSSGVYRLTDISTNGVYHNNNKQPIGKGCSVTLKDGDKLQIHEYDIFVFEENISEGYQDNIPSSNNFFTGNVATSETQFPETLDDWGYPESDVKKAPLSGALLSEIFQVAVENQDPYRDNSSNLSGKKSKEKYPNASELNLDQQQNPLNGIASAPPFDLLSKQHDHTKVGISQKFNNEFVPKTKMPASEELISGEVINPEALKAFFESLGRSKDIPKGQDAVVIMREIGGCFNMMAQLILNACQDSNGNKNLNAALNTMLNVSAKDYDLISATNTFSEALADIQAHEIPSISGTSSAYNTLLATFDPKSLEKIFDQQSSGRLFIQKKAWYWDEYSKYYKDISDRSDR